MITLKRVGKGLAALVVVGVGVVACSDSKCPAGQACDGVDGGGIAPPDVSGGGCDSNKPAAQGGCAVDDSDGFFVAAGGNDSGPGTRDQPFLTIGAGVSAAKAGAKKNVYVCAGKYDESIVIDAAASGVALHGGFACPGSADAWKHTGAPTLVQPSKPGLVLKVAGSPAVIEDLSLVAADAVDPGDSSVVALVDAAPGMTFRRATLTAGNGMTGAAGAAIAQAAQQSSGKDATLQAEGNSTTCTCGDGSSTTGGHGSHFGVGGTAGQPTVDGDLTTGLPGDNTYCNGTGHGGGGHDGDPGAASNGATSFGQLTSQGWAPQGGAVGKAGSVAQGGGGGGGEGPGGNGGGGGCGGCGGAGGAGGEGGGGSIAILSLNSTLRLQFSTVRTGKAGDGGDGNSGQIGQVGGVGGGGAPVSTPGCDGGNGGNGGNGGPGGGGAGGVSYGIAYIGAAPDVDTVTIITPGTAGKAGHGGAPQVPAGDGVPGEAKAQKAF